MAIAQCVNHQTVVIQTAPYTLPINGSFTQGFQFGGSADAPILSQGTEYDASNPAAHIAGQIFYRINSNGSYSSLQFTSSYTPAYYDAGGIWTEWNGAFVSGVVANGSTYNVTSWAGSLNTSSYTNQNAPTGTTSLIIEGDGLPDATVLEWRNNAHWSPLWYNGQIQFLVSIGYNYSNGKPGAVVISDTSGNLSLVRYFYSGFHNSPTAGIDMISYPRGDGATSLIYYSNVSGYPYFLWITPQSYDANYLAYGPTDTYYAIAFDNSLLNTACYEAAPVVRAVEDGFLIIPPQLSDGTRCVIVLDPNGLTYARYDLVSLSGDSNAYNMVSNQAFNWNSTTVDAYANLRQFKALYGGASTEGSYGIPTSLSVPVIPIPPAVELPCVPCCFIFLDQTSWNRRG